jgi:hypothetical protein
MNDMMMEIISLKNQLIPGQLDIKSGLMFQMACYDLDKFRTHVFEKGLLSGRNLDNDAMEALKTDDKALLKFSLQWVKESLFGKK